MCFRLSKRERAELEYKKKVLDLAKQHCEAGEAEKTNRYYVPKDDVTLEDHYVEDAREKGPNSEQRRWEEEHLSAAVLRFGARDAKRKHKTKEYDVIMDEEIEFVQALQMPGTVTEEVKCDKLFRGGGIMVNRRLEFVQSVQMPVTRIVKVKGNRLLEYMGGDYDKVN